MGKSKNRYVFEESPICKDAVLSKAFYALQNDLEYSGLIDRNTYMHILNKHVGMQLETMRLMCERNQTFECSTYLSKDDCTRAIRYGLTSQWFRVTSWLKFSSEDRLVLNCDMPFDTEGTNERIHGIGVDREDLDHVYECRTQCLVLKRTPKSRYGFMLFTAYPTYRDMKLESERFRSKVSKELS